MTQDEQEFKQGWQRLKDTMTGIALALLVVLFIHKCSGDFEPKTATIRVPEAKGGFKALKPESIPIYKTDTVYLKSKTYNSGDFRPDYQYIAKLQAENEQLSRAYYLQSDSVRKGLYEKAIQLNEFSQTFEDTLTKIEVSGVSRGTVESLGVSYKLKERKIQAPQKLVRFRLLGGVYVANDVMLQKPLFGANVGFQNKRGNVLRFGYDSEKRILVGYDLSIFRIQK